MAEEIKTQQQKRNKEAVGTNLRIPEAMGRYILRIYNKDPVLKIGTPGGAVRVTLWRNIVEEGREGRGRINPEINYVRGFKNDILTSGDGTMDNFIPEVEYLINGMNHNMERIVNTLLEMRPGQGGGGSPTYPTSASLRSAAVNGVDWGAYKTMIILSGEPTRPHRGM